MSHFVLELPETLHRQLETQARIEGTSLDKYLVYALTRHADYAYRVHAVPKEDVVQQRARFEALRENLPKASPAEVEKILAERDMEREASKADYDDLPSEVVHEFRQRIKTAREAQKEAIAS